jgi:hypothetical protein
MPSATALPGDLKALNTRNALEIHDAHFRNRCDGW